MGQKLGDAERTALTDRKCRSAKIIQGHHERARTAMAKNARRWLLMAGFVLVFFLSLTFIRHPAVVLIIGTTVGLTVGNPFGRYSKQTAAWLLGLSITLIGATSNLGSIGHSFEHIWIVVLMIVLTLLASFALARIFQLPSRLSLLIASGTAICGGSAILATSQAVGASEEETVISLSTIFFLNAISLAVLPIIAGFLQLTEPQFGLWAALAIHDTGSVIAAAMGFGPVATEQATTIKILRALFMIPLVAMLAFTWTNGERTPVHPLKRIPWFIPAFFIAAIAAHFIPALPANAAPLSVVAKICMLGALFLLGSTFTLAGLKALGARPFTVGFLLWIGIAVASLGVVLM